jgi:hypothetical protein
MQSSNVQRSAVRGLYAIAQATPDPGCGSLQKGIGAGQNTQPFCHRERVGGTCRGSHKASAQSRCGAHLTGANPISLGDAICRMQ